MTLALTFVSVAVHDLDTAIGRNADLERAHFYRGILHFNTGDDVDAVADFNKAIQLDPQDAKALYIRGLAKRRNGDVTNSDADVAAAKALDPDVENQVQIQHGPPPPSTVRH